MAKKLDWIKINNRYKGMWVALNEQETLVVSSSKNAKSAYRQALERGVESPILFHVPDEALSYIGLLK